jgi:hypothetical protein
VATFNVALTLECEFVGREVLVAHLQQISDATVGLGYAGLKSVAPCAESVGKLGWIGMRIADGR